jgi:hypothetical protein
LFRIIQNDDEWKNQTTNHFVSVSAVDSGTPARAVRFWDLLPVEEDVDNYNSNNNILPNSDFSQIFPQFDDSAVKSSGIKNTLFENTFESTPRKR